MPTYFILDTTTIQGRYLLFTDNTTTVLIGQNNTMPVISFPLLSYAPVISDPRTGHKYRLIIFKTLDLIPFKFGYCLDRSSKTSGWAIKAKSYLLTILHTNHEGKKGRKKSLAALSHGISVLFCCIFLFKFKLCINRILPYFQRYYCSLETISIGLWLSS